jgi:protein gp37
MVHLPPSEIIKLSLAELETPVITLPLSVIRIDGGTQMRETFKPAVIKEYTEAMKAGSQFPPLGVVFDGEDYWLWDGFHRYTCAKDLAQEEIEVEVRHGNRRDAVLLAVGANKSHGLQRTSADKRRAVMALLNDGVWSVWSNREIARQCGVSEELVRRLRPICENLADTERTVSRNGTTYTMDVSSIGTQPEEAEEAGTWECNNCGDTVGAGVEACPGCGQFYGAVTMPTVVEDEDEEEDEEASRWDELVLVNPSPAIPPGKVEFISLAELTFAGVTPLLAKRGRQEPATFNRTNDNVEWALWTWNPITGCLHDCDYCYARDIAERFYPQGFVPTFHPDRLTAPRNMRVPEAAKQNIGEKNVFVCSMADLFGKWVPREWIDAVLAEVIAAPQWNFLFLTKFPQRLCEFKWPKNAWVGTTVDRQYRVDIAEKAFRKVTAGVKWLSCEPMLEPLKFSSLEMFDWVVCGGASRSSQTEAFQPEREWVTRLHYAALEAGCKWYEKPNLRPAPVREYPGR